MISAQARRVERKYPSFSRGSALDGRGFINAKAHEAAHHYVKVVSTHFDVGSFLSSLSADASTAVGYQTLVQTQTMAYHELDVPEAKFSYDLSPMAVAVRTSGKRWYDFVTSICAIVGGCVEIKFHVAFVLNRRVDLHAIDAAPARRRGDAGFSPLDGASTAAS